MKTSETGVRSGAASDGGGMLNAALRKRLYDTAGQARGPADALHCLLHTAARVMVEQAEPGATVEQMAGDLDRALRGFLADLTSS